MASSQPSPSHESPEHPRNQLYQLLDEPRKEIRVLHILPSSDPTSPVQATLHTVSLEDPKPPVFKALSYCWGDASVTQPIFLDGVMWEVTINLESALRHLRNETEEVHLWADAVCINQDDISERNSQVRMMADIYRGADLVVVWLGEEGDDTDLAMDTVADWGSHHMKTHPEFNHLYILKDVVQFNKRKWVAIRNLFSRPYWSRLWIYQEIQLARRALVKCGHKEVAWENFAGLDEAWTQIHRKKIMLRQSMSTAEWNMVENSGVTELDLFFDYAKIKQHDETFFHIVRRTAGQQCTNPKDRMYAIMSLAKDADQYPRPDYGENVTVNKVYTDFARSHIRLSGSLECLNEASCRLYDQREQNGGLPSWVPNWRVKGQNGIQFKNHDEVADSFYASRLYDIFLRNPAIPEQEEIEAEEAEVCNPIPSHLPVIRPLGVKCDTISKVAHTSILGMNYAKIVEFMGRGPDGSHPTSEPLFNVLFRTSLMGIFPVTMGFGTLFPITQSDLTSDLAKGFLLQVALDYGYLRRKLPHVSRLVVDGSFGRVYPEEYEFAYPGFDVDFRFLDLNPESEFAKANPEFATFRSFRDAIAKEDKLDFYWFTIDHFRQRVKDAAQGRTLFVTKYGYIGLATNPNIREGDIVTVLYGGKTPFILRDAESGMAEADPEYCLMSDAYVYGLMEGEAIKFQDRWMRDSRGQPALRRFTIV